MRSILFASIFCAAPVAQGAGPADRPVSPHAEFSAVARVIRAGTNEYCGSARLRQMESTLNTVQLTPGRRSYIESHLALEYLNHGRIEDAMKTVEAIFQRLQQSPTALDKLPSLHLLRALVYLRQSEITNCVLRNNAQCCLLPLQGGGVHERPEPARRAMQSYMDYLRLNPDDLTARWLLNIAAMAAGTHPQDVPEHLLIPAEAFASEHDTGRFTNVAGELGVDALNLCGGCIVEDFNGDGTLDIVTSTFDLLGPLTFYTNQGDGTFVDRSIESSADRQLGGLNCIGADYDNDGDVDVLILRGAWLYEEGRIRNSLLRNEGDGTFTDVTHAAGVHAPACPTQTAAWADIDNDGDLDLYIANESRNDPAHFKSEDMQAGDYPAQLFRNEGDGTFTDIASAAGVMNDRYGKGVTAGDYDNDGDIDLYVSNIGVNRLYKNNGDGTFLDVAQQAGVTEPAGRSFATWFFDHNNDGWLDLFVAAYDAEIDDVAASYLNLPDTATRPCLYRNNRDGTFTDVARDAGLDRPFLPMGANFGDIDHDGWLDIYLTTGEPDYQSLMPNIMLRNDAGKRFQDVTTAGGLGHLQKGHGVAFADIDNDGDQDIYHQLGGFYAGDKYHNALFLNPGNGNHFLYVCLEGVRSNRAAFGARITVTVETTDGMRSIHRTVGSVSSFGGSPFRQEIGLGDARSIERLDITWPASNTTQTFNTVPLDACLHIHEGADHFEMLEFNPIVMRGK